MMLYPQSRYGLIVYDQADIRLLIRITLECVPKKIHETAGGSAGLRLAGEVKSDLIQLDMMMSEDLVGLQVCTQVRGNPAL